MSDNTSSNNSSSNNCPSHNTSANNPRITLDSMLGIKYPIMQGGMAQIANGAFAAAVSEAGALGIIAAGGRSANELREQIKIAKAATDKPFGVNVMLMAKDVAEIAELLANENIAVITTGAGDPSAYIEKWRAAGSKVIPVVPSVALALRMQRAGADGVVAEGTESGGHVGELTTMALVPQVVDAIDIPTIAAGGIASGRQLCAAFSLGAIGVQIGTVLLASEECPIHENYKLALLKARDTGTVVTGRAKNAPVRVLKNKMAKKYLELEKGEASREEFEYLTLGSLKRAVLDGDEERGSFMAGQVAGQITEIRPISEILADIMSGYRAAVTELPELATAVDFANAMSGGTASGSAASANTASQKGGSGQ